MSFFHFNLDQITVEGANDRKSPHMFGMYSLIIKIKDMLPKWLKFFHFLTKKKKKNDIST